MKTSHRSGIFAGAFLFVFTGAWLVLDLGIADRNLDVGVAGGYTSGWLVDLSTYWYFFWLLLAAIGFTVGYIRNFPAWSYAYTGLFFLLGLFIGWSYSEWVDIWLGDLFPPSIRGMVLPWIYFIPLVVCLLITRSLRPLGRFFTNLNRDASQLSFAFFAGFPVLIWLTYVDDHSPWKVWILLLHAIALVLAAFFYLRATTIWRRTAALAFGTFSNVIILYVLTLTSWELDTPGDAAAIFSSGIMLCLYILLPALLGSAYALFEPSKRSVAGEMDAD